MHPTTCKHHTFTHSHAHTPKCSKTRRSAPLLHLVPQNPALAPCTMTTTNLLYRQLSSALCFHYANRLHFTTMAINSKQCLSSKHNISQYSLSLIFSHRDYVPSTTNRSYYSSVPSSRIKHSSLKAKTSKKTTDSGATPRKRQTSLIPTFFSYSASIHVTGCKQK